MSTYRCSHILLEQGSQTCGPRDGQILGKLRFLNEKLDNFAYFSSKLFLTQNLKNNEFHAARESF